MITSVVEYLGDLRTICTHVASGNTYLTDAPIDNQGKGEAFSPTDTVATGLANCMLTVMGIKAKELQVDIMGTTAEVTKYMAIQPRRISKISVLIKFPKKLSSKHQLILEKVGLTCPVGKSLHPDIEQDITFCW